MTYRPPARYSGSFPVVASVVPEVVLSTTPPVMIYANEKCRVPFQSLVLEDANNVQLLTLVNIFSHNNIKARADEFTAKLFATSHDHSLYKAFRKTIYDLLVVEYQMIKSNIEVLQKKKKKVNRNDSKPRA